MPKALTSMRRESLVLISPLPSIGIPKGLTTRPTMLRLQDTHDAACTADGVAFLDEGVIAEQYGADVVFFQVQAMP